MKCYEPQTRSLLPRPSFNYTTLSMSVEVEYYWLIFKISQSRRSRSTWSFCRHSGSQAALCSEKDAIGIGWRQYRQVKETGILPAIRRSSFQRSSIKWWRRRESNSRLETNLYAHLHACFTYESSPSRLPMNGLSKSPVCRHFFLKSRQTAS